MKSKLITAIAAAAIIVGVSGVSASAWSHGSMMGNGMMNGSGATVEDNQKFLADTKGMRIQIAADQAELNALMAGPNSDSTRVRDLAESIATNQISIQDMSGSYRNGNGNGHMNRMHMGGSGMTNGGYGGCNW